MRRGTSLILVLIGIALIATAVIFLSRAWVRSLMSHPMEDGQTTLVSFIVEKGDTTSELATRLEARGIIRSGFAFAWTASSKGLESRFRPGTYRISKGMTGDVILARLTSNSAELRVTIPEGLTIVQIAQRLSDAGIADPSSIRTCAQTCPFDLPLLATRPEGASLEGYLFPDTYDFTTGMMANDVVATLVRTMDKRFNADLREKAAAQKRSVHEILTVASMLEKEVTAPRDRRIVAGIIWARLEKGIPLGIDATVLYALGGWKDTLTAEDLRIDSPYNTRIVKGLPPGPICNPGLEAITAALEPEETPYLFYLTDSRGTVHYARTNAEHEQNKATHLND